MQDTGCLGLVHWDDPEGGYGEGGGREVQDGEHMYGKTIALTRWTFVGKVMSLLFNTLSRLVIAFLPRSKAFMAAVTVCPSMVTSTWPGTGPRAKAAVLDHLRGPGGRIWRHWLDFQFCVAQTPLEKEKKAGKIGNM